jgi:hypothetical protein
VALIYLVNKPQVSSIITRWLLLFLEYDFKIVYKLGRSHLITDALSRLPNQAEPIGNEKHVDCAPTNSMIDNFLNVSKINDYESVVYLIASSQNFHHLSLFENQNSKNFKFLNYIMAIHET